MPHWALTEVCVSWCSDVCVRWRGAMAYREAAECCVCLSEIRMILPSGRTETMHCQVLNSVCQLMQNRLCVCWAREVPYIVGSRAMYVSGGAEGQL